MPDATVPPREIANRSPLNANPLRFGALANRDCGALPLHSDALLVASLEDAGTPKERPNGVGRLRALIEPVIGSGLVDLERALTLPGSVLPDDFDELAVAGHLRIGDENAIERRIFPPDSAEANLYHLNCSLEGEKMRRFRASNPGSSRYRKFRHAPGDAEVLNLIGLRTTDQRHR